MQVHLQCALEMSGKNEDARFCFIADDLTGAMDTGVGLAKAGLSAVITFSSCAAIESDAVVITTDSRADAATDAYRRVRAVGERYQDYLIYKKVDSTLRGNIAAELQALLDATRIVHTVVCPAFPAIRRTVEKGRLLVDGVPVEKTQFATDPVSPVRKSDIGEILKTGSGIATEYIDIRAVEKGPAHVAQTVNSSSARALIVDATEDSHLRCIADAMAMSEEPWLPCGSGGLGAQIPLAYGHEPRAAAIPAAPDGPALLAVGSRNEVSVHQLTRLLNTLNPPLVKAEPREFRTRDGRTPRIYQLAHEIEDLLSNNRVVVLSSSLSQFSPQMRHTMAPVLGGIVTRVLENGPPAGLFLCGGDVARSVCGDTGIQALRILGDLQPGVIAGEVVGDNYAGMRVITKAGGFGDENAMVQVAHHLSNGG